jgi:signal transduction histidine kinase
VSKILFGNFGKTSLEPPHTHIRRRRTDGSFLSQRLLHAQEDERRHIAQELHDGLNQSMAMLEVEVGMMLQNLPPAASSMRSDLTRLRGRVQGLSDEVRRISHRLHPAVLDHLGLVSALKSLCSEFRAGHNMDVLFASQGAVEKISFHIAVCLYRISQEALCNAAKHANATEVVLSVTSAEGKVRLSITDDGCGFDVLQRKQDAGLGLISMYERARAAGGHCSINSQCGLGTRIEVVIPTQEAWQWKILSETLLPVK